MRIVIVSGTIYPHISARAFRATELAKGLARMGHDVTLYAILGEYDYSGFERETGVKVRSLGKSRFGNYDSDGKCNWTFGHRVLKRLLYNVIDYPRCEYLHKTYNALCREKPFDLLITVAHPFGIHWGAAFFKKKHPGLFKAWISDCGDPFMGNPHDRRWKLFLKPLECFWGRQTDLISIPVENGKTGYYEEFRDKIVVIPQSVDFDSVELDEYKGNVVPTFLYAGTVYPGIRNPREFLEYLCEKGVDFKFYVFAPDDVVFEDFKEKLGDRLEMRRFVPRSDLLRMMSRMDFLVNINNESAVQTPSKLIDYGLSRRPILNVSSHLTEREKASIDAFLQGDYSSSFAVPDLEQYDTKNVCRKFMDACERIVALAK